MRFSVIIPLYNKAPFIEKALESVIAQSFQDYELILIDDGSTDSSYCIAESILKKTEINYKLIRQKNSGVSTARNKGVAASHGEFICFLDADDWWSPIFLERMDLFIRNYPNAGIYGTNYYSIKNGRQNICVTTAETGYINYCKVYAVKLQMPLWTGAVCLPKRIFNEMGGFRSHLRLGEDFDLWIRIVMKYKVAFLNEALSYYSQDSDATWRLVGKLHDPKYHMLWNLDYLSEKETDDPDYKKLIDGLRTYSLLPYYISRQYHDMAKQELAKVDWDLQPKKTQILYKRSLPYLRFRRTLLKCGSSIKQWLIKLL